MARTAAVIGGSIGGLFSAVTLRNAGWNVKVYERARAPLSGRGAGIVTHPQLLDALDRVGANTADLGVQVHDRVVFDREGERIHTLPYPQVVTSWDRMHQTLRRMIPDADYHLGETLTGYADDGEGVSLTFASGTRDRVDLLVGADGFRSAVRAQMLPKVQPAYAGYVVWRALAQEAELSADMRARIFDVFGMFMPAGTQIVGYPIAGENNDLRPGHRRYNFVWYVPVSTQDLADLLTDADGKTHAISIPPPLVRDDVVSWIEGAAARILPDVFCHILDKSERPFFTPIYDHLSPTFARGRVALAGDAACVARPHVGMGVTKAAQDALALAEHVAGDVAAGLQAYSDERVPASQAAYERAQLLGRYMKQVPEAGDPTDGRNNAHMEEIIRLTAVADFP
ncbi:FAD binding domain-containing protein [Gymnodinialimonas ceratoperidinii]|uniref:FAD binding domain-containing protein n=1 Tax=Gymnodinialimonas ceratoperidinii TaxID=2856823 RepID=A0A8F6U0F9_9RHOB|nr:FAD binding domain-containing protein [Gymnodinialimonas ceratoperidinii]QXT41071.1 FAD binding domain-containing protein [Gymnodinialimonas ceratoperidinii]